MVGQSRLGIGLVSLIALLREEGRLPLATIPQFLRTVHGVARSVGALVGAVRQVARCAAPLLTPIRTAIRASPVVGADETGWREDGANGYVWTFNTPTERLFVRGTREKAVLERERGPAYDGVLVSDVYGASTHSEGRHQSCWAHLLRDVHDLVTAQPRDAGVRGWAAAVHDLFVRALAVTGDGATRCRAARALQADLAALCAPYLPVAPAADAPVPPQRTLCQRIARHLADLVVFVEDPTVPATNNGSERSLRPPRRQPQDQRRHALRRGEHHQDDPGLGLRGLAGARAQSLRRVPQPARLPSTLNSYKAPERGEHRWFGGVVVGGDMRNCPRNSSLRASNPLCALVRSHTMDSSWDGGYDYGERCGAGGDGRRIRKLHVRRGR
ncbi:MAG: hypothetical protein KatS3mg059_1343 [Thermomicrobiales bacterium]|nr:MAG: hypothetical protein KatS3mg059_1343 [Thermomicrobiales bacterium]